jgi:putative transposase
VTGTSPRIRNVIHDACWEWRPAWHVRACSIDLRERVLAAVLNKGMSARGAAARFGIKESSAIKWVERHRQTGAVAPAQVGVYRPRLLASDLRDWLLERNRSDFTLLGLLAELAMRGVKVDYVQGSGLALVARQSGQWKDKIYIRGAGQTFVRRSTCPHSSPPISTKCKWGRGDLDMIRGDGGVSTLPQYPSVSP